MVKKKIETCKTRKITKLMFFYNEKNLLKLLWSKLYDKKLSRIV